MSGDTKYRCNACGNLTRFDITATRTTQSFHHYSIGGELVVEEEDVLSEEVHEAWCRWCGTAAHVVVVTNDARRNPA